jgi:hypothetical protein
MDLLDPGATLTVGGVIVWLGRRLLKAAIKQIAETLAEIRSLHVKLDAHMADDAQRHEASQESMRELWGMLGKQRR